MRMKLSFHLCMIRGNKTTRSLQAAQIIWLWLYFEDLHAQVDIVAVPVCVAFTHASASMKLLSSTV